MFKKLAISTFTLLSFLPVTLEAAPVEIMANNNIDSLEYSTSGLKSTSDRGITKENIDRSIFKDSLKIEFIGARIVANFAPKNNLGESIELEKLADLLGYDRFSWVSYVEKDPHGITNQQGQLLSTPYNDPPMGGYQYDAADELPFYWDQEECDRCNPRHHYQHPLITQKYQLVFEDIPSDPRLQPGEAIEFITHLVGVKNYDAQNKKAEWDVLNTFRWQLTNPIPGLGRVSLVETNIDLAKLSTLLLVEMQTDGALLSDAVWIAHRRSLPTIDTPLTLMIEESSTETIR